MGSNLDGCSDDILSPVNLRYNLWDLCKTQGLVDGNGNKRERLTGVHSQRNWAEIRHRLSEFVPSASAGAYVGR